MPERLNLKQMRLVRGLSMQDMADKLNIHVNTYRMWEHDPLKITIGNAFQISKILETTVDQIFFEQ